MKKTLMKIRSFWRYCKSLSKKGPKVSPKKPKPTQNKPKNNWKPPHPKTTPKTKPKPTKQKNNPTPSQTNKKRKNQNNKKTRPGLVAKAAFPSMCTCARMREIGWDKRKLWSFISNLLFSRLNTPSSLSFSLYER